MGSVVRAGRPRSFPPGWSAIELLGVESGASVLEIGFGQGRTVQRLRDANETVSLLETAGFINVTDTQHPEVSAETHWFRAQAPT